MDPNSNQPRAPLEISVEPATSTDSNQQQHRRRWWRRGITLAPLNHFHQHWKGANPIRVIIPVAFGIVLRFAVPKPWTVTTQAWQLLAIFVTTILGLILSPLPVGGWAFVCLTATVATRTLPFAAAMSAVTSEVVWLIVVSFFFARGLVKSGLGERMAAWFVRLMGRSTLGLSYGLVVCEALVSPAIPSSTARAGGVFGPVIKSLAVAGCSFPKDPSARKIGAYLIQSQLQVRVLLLERAL